MMGIELMTSSLPRMRSTPELHRQSLERGRRIELPFPAWKAGIIAIIRTPLGGFTPLWWARMDSNHRRYNQQIYSLPHLATLVLALKYANTLGLSEPMGGFEPSTPRLQITCSGQLSYIGKKYFNPPLAEPKGIAKINKFFELQKSFLKKSYKISKFFLYPFLIYATKPSLFTLRSMINETVRYAKT